MKRLEKLGLDPLVATPVSSRSRSVRQGVSPVERWAASETLLATPDTWFFLGTYKNPNAASAAAYNINKKRGFGYLELGWVQAASNYERLYVRALSDRRETR